MGKLHDDWKKVKANAKNVDTKNLLKLNLGDALDKFDTAWDKIKPVFEAKKQEKTLKKAEVATMVAVMDPLWDKAGKIIVKYEQTLTEVGTKNKSKADKTADQKEKAKLKATADDLKKLITSLSDLKGAVAEPVMVMKMAKSKLET